MRRNVNEKPFLYSQSLYDFNLDTRQLRISDTDYFCPGSNVTLAMGFPVKRISANVAQLETCEARLAIADAEDIEEACKNSRVLDKSVATLTIARDSANFKIRDVLHLAASDALLLLLSYTVLLEGNGSRLLFCGSVQPSDYYGVRNMLRINEIRKTVELRVHSRKPQKVCVFSGAEQCHFPTNIPQARSLHGQADRYFYRKCLDIRLDDWDRASYFSIAQG